MDWVLVVVMIWIGLGIGALGIIILNLTGKDE